MLFGWNLPVRRTKETKPKNLLSEDDAERTLQLPRFTEPHGPMTPPRVLPTKANPAQAMYAPRFPRTKEDAPERRQPRPTRPASQPATPPRSILHGDDQKRHRPGKPQARMLIERTGPVEPLVRPALIVAFTKRKFDALDLKPGGHPTDEHPGEVTASWFSTFSTPPDAWLCRSPNGSVTHKRSPTVAMPLDSPRCSTWVRTTRSGRPTARPRSMSSSITMWGSRQP
ncbi:hypothetical protein LX90_009244 [Lentzea flava]|nr:hypothetical protein [Lentzea flava]